MFTELRKLPKEAKQFVASFYDLNVILVDIPCGAVTHLYRHPVLAVVTVAIIFILFASLRLADDVTSVF